MDYTRVSDLIDRHHPSRKAWRETPTEGVVLTYIAGPMTACPNWNIPSFAGLAARLRAAGLAVINPHELYDANLGHPWDWYLRRDIAELVKCDRVVLLPGWARSVGACVEEHIARKLGMEIIYPEDLDMWLLAYEAQKEQAK